ncbi:phage tail protein [Limnobaculum xujianqingii]|uniref:phage tail protein n=1 Tax=Limnobaculum xujianqingii TaxID=2738837 RepID=UPI001126DDE2|nr:phage tail protein [Limnobaculum xujianqingii]
MAIEEYIGSIVMEVDSREVEITDLGEQINTGKKIVKTMNSKGVAKGFSRGIATYDLDISAVVPLDGDIDWENLEGVKITITPLSGSGGQRYSYLDCFTSEVGRKYTVDNEAKIDIKMSAMRKVYES